MNRETAQNGLRFLEYDLNGNSGESRNILGGSEPELVKENVGGGGRAKAVDRTDKPIRLSCRLGASTREGRLGAAHQLSL